MTLPLPEPTSKDSYVTPIVNKIAWLTILVISIALVVLNIVGITHFDTMEIIAFISGLISVWLAVLNSHWNWPIGIVNCIAFFILFWQARLFANAALQVLFIIISIWGWYEWLMGGKNKTALPITRMNRPQIVRMTLLFPILSIIIGTLLVKANGSATIWDAATTSASIIAIYIMGKRQIENWIIWVSVDTVYLFLFISQDLTLTAFLYIIFLIMSTNGFIAWKRERTIYNLRVTQSQI